MERNVTETTRREFLTLAIAAAFEASTGTARASAAVPSATPRSYAKLTQLAPGAIAPQGWLRLYLEKQATTLGISLPDVSWPWTENFWAGAEETVSWWPWEQVGYWTDGSTRCALVLGDQALLERTFERTKFTLANRYALANRASTYVGAQAIVDPTVRDHRWPHVVFFRALAALEDSGTLQGIPEIMTEFYLNDKADYAQQRNVANIEHMIWVYQHTGNAKLLELAKRSWASFLVKGAEETEADLTEKRVYANEPCVAHGCTYAECSKLPAILYNATGDPEYLKFALAAQQRIFDHHMLVDGIPSTAEHLGPTTPLDSHETCDISDYTWTWGYMLMSTGDAVWADRIERACFNAGMGAIKKDWTALQYFSCPNQVLANSSSNHNPYHQGNWWMAYAPNPGRDVQCCGGNVHRIFPNYATRMWMQTPEGGLAAVLYGASDVSAHVGSTRQLVTVEQRTSYPFEEQISFTVRCKVPVEFELKLRIPQWCNEPVITVNGVVWKDLTTSLGFARLHRTFRTGDVVVLQLPMQVKSTSWPTRGIAFERGPLVYVYPVATKWSSEQIAKCTTEAYPSWNAEPVASWNFGIPADSSPKPGRTLATGDPWNAPPVHLEIQAQKLTSWEIESPVGATASRFTPPLPEDRTKLATPEKIRLVPYGSTELRLTIFPKLGV
jgi:hypothetical protein